MNEVLVLIGMSATQPRAAAERLLDRRFDRGSAFSLLALSVIAIVLMMFAFSGGAPVSLVPTLDPVEPAMALIIFGCTTIIMGYAIFFTGNAMKGAGSLINSMVVVAWMQILRFAALVVQGILLLLSPPFAAMVSLVIMFGLIWVLLVFVDVLHEFNSIGRAAILMLFVIVGIGLGFSLILGMIGVGL